MNLNRPVRTRAIVGSLVTIALLGCAFVPDRIPITPDYPTLGKSRPTRYSISSLVVDTETWIDVNLASGDDGAVVRPTGYRLYDGQGVELMYVRNYIGSLDSEPTTLDLEPGQYLIRPDKPGRRPPIFWVVVEPGRQTEVNLRK